MRILSALEDCEVPLPRLVDICPDEDVLPGAAFYLMEPIDGVNATVSTTPAHHVPGAVRDMGLAMVDVLADLGRVDYVARGLGDLGQPGPFLRRQVQRWTRELDSYSQLAGYAEADLPGLSQVVDYLERGCPTEAAPGLIHGDFHIANVMYSPTSTDIVAVVDWEMATIGDPLLDLGWLLATWPHADNKLFEWNGIAYDPGLPTESDLLQRYAEGSDRNLSQVTWYTVLACFKVSVILEGSYARSCAGQVSQDIGRTMYHAARSLLRQALDRIAKVE